jgi:hypothetical protein
LQLFAAHESVQLFPDAIDRLLEGDEGVFSPGSDHPLIANAENLYCATVFWLAVLVLPMKGAPRRTVTGRDVPSRRKRENVRSAISPSIFRGSDRLCDRRRRAASLVLPNGVKKRHSPPFVIISHEGGEGGAKNCERLKKGSFAQRDLGQYLVWPFGGGAPSDLVIN